MRWSVRIFTFPEGEHKATLELDLDEDAIYEIAEAVNNTERLSMMVDPLL